jgi:hypothetical protein
MPDISKDWATYDQERGPAEKTGRMAGTLAGVAGAAKVGRMAFRRLGRAGVRKVPPRVALAGVAAYGTYQGVKHAAGYVGRKIDDAVGRVAKDWTAYDAARGKSDPHKGRDVGGRIGAVAGILAAPHTLTYGGLAGLRSADRAATYSDRKAQDQAPKGSEADMRRWRRAQNLADRPGTPGEGTAARAAADRLKAKIGPMKPGSKIAGRVHGWLSRTHMPNATWGASYKGPPVNGKMAVALATGVAAVGGGIYAGRKIGQKVGSLFDKGLFSGGDTPLGGFLNPDKVKARNPAMGGMLQGRTKAFAGPNRALGGPDVTKGLYAVERTVAIIKGSVEQTMHEFKHGKLHSGSKHGPRVSNRKQAIAIALSQAGLSRG